MAIKRARLEVCHATAILRMYLHDPDAQGILQLLTIAIDDADKVITKLQHGVKDHERERTSAAPITTPPKSGA